MKKSMRLTSLALLCSGVAIVPVRAAEPQPTATELSKITVQEAVDSDYVAPNATTGT